MIITQLYIAYYKIYAKYEQAGRSVLVATCNSNAARDKYLEQFPNCYAKPVYVVATKQV
jgi:hypothetical protein